MKLGGGLLWGIWGKWDETVDMLKTLYTCIKFSISKILIIHLIHRQNTYTHKKTKNIENACNPSS